MKRLALAALVVAGFAGVALAQSKQRAVTFKDAETTVQVVEIRSLEDGGVSLTVYATNEPTGTGVALDGQVTCEPGTLTAAQRTALLAVRNNALACWNAGKGL